MGIGKPSVYIAIGRSNPELETHLGMCGAAERVPFWLTGNRSNDEALFCNIDCAYRDGICFFPDGRVEAPWTGYSDRSIKERAVFGPRRIIFEFITLKPQSFYAGGHNRSRSKVIWLLCAPPQMRRA